MIDPKHVTACLITKEDAYPEEVLRTVQNFGFAAIIIYPRCPSIAGRLKIFEQATTPFLFTQDDDSICPLEVLFEEADPERIATVMGQNHITWYASRPHCLMNWGAVFPKYTIERMKLYTDRYGEDAIYLREFDRIFTGLNFPQKRLNYPVINLPIAFGPDRLSADPLHYEYMNTAETRLAELSAMVSEEYPPQR